MTYADTIDKVTISRLIKTDGFVKTIVFEGI